MWRCHLCGTSGKTPERLLCICEVEDAFSGMRVGGSRTTGALRKHLIGIQGLGRAPQEREGRTGFPHCFQEDFFVLISHWASVLCPTQSPGAQNLSTVLRSREADCIPPYARDNQPHPSLGDKVVMKSRGASFAHHSKSGQYQDYLIDDVQL